MSQATPPLRPVSAIAALRALRCARHPDREAAARCPSCSQPCCRECTNEYEGRLLCANCFTKAIAAAEKAKPKRDLAPVRRALATTVGFFALWMAFQLLATALTRIPVEFHDATVWATDPSGKKADPKKP